MKNKRLRQGWRRGVKNNRHNGDDGWDNNNCGDRRREEGKKISKKIKLKN